MNEINTIRCVLLGNRDIITLGKIIALKDNPVQNRTMGKTIITLGSGTRMVLKLVIRKMVQLACVRTYYVKCCCRDHRLTEVLVVAIDISFYVFLTYKMDRMEE